MNNTTLKVFLKPEARKDKTHLVLIRITKDRKRAYFSLGFYVAKESWNKKAKTEDRNWIKKNEGLFESYNERIEAALKGLRLLAMRLEDTGKPFTAAELKEAYTAPEVAPEGMTFTAFFETELKRREQLYKKGVESYSSWRKHTSVYNVLNTYLKEKPLPFEHLTVPFLERYRHYLVTDQGDDPDTATKHLSVIRTNIVKAVRQGLMADADNPFHHIEVKYLKKRKERLTMEELVKIRDTPLEGLAHHARNVYMLQFFLHGARVGDVLLLRAEQIDFEQHRVRYQMGKNDKWMSVRISDSLRAVLLHYLPALPSGFLLPFLPADLNLQDEQQTRKAIESKTTIINRELKEVCKASDVKKHLTTHTARHTFTSLAVRSDVSPAMVQAMLGHASMRQTQQYMDEFREGELDSYSDTIYGGF